MFDFSNMMDQMNKMQEAVQATREQLLNERITVTAGGDAVTIVIDGSQRIISLSLSPAALSAAQADPEILQDLLVSALNNAIEQSQTLAAERLNYLSSQFNLPGM